MCISNEGNEASLESRKPYERVTDAHAEKLGQVRVIDKSGEDYLYPQSFFESVELSPPVEKKFLHAAYSVIAGGGRYPALQSYISTLFITACNQLTEAKRLSFRIRLTSYMA